MTPGLPWPNLRSTIGARARALVGSGQVDLGRSPGDDGLFGVNSMSWRVHGDFSSMMIGGVSALLLQTLHPLALAGVWDHSDFRRDRLGRLRRTAQFIALTTFGGTARADEAVQKVRRIHDRVSGALADGTPYDANDPALLTWVHVAEVDSFLRAYVRYRDPALTGAEQDRYLAETATIARALGATDVPETRRAIGDYYAAVRPELRFDDRTREVASALLAPGDDAATNGVMALVTQASVDLLPVWAQALHGRSVPAFGRPAVRMGARGMSNVLRWALARK